LSNMSDAQIFNNAANVFSQAVDKFSKSFSDSGGIESAAKRAFTGNQLRLQTDKPRDAVLGKNSNSPALAITSDMGGALLNSGRVLSPEIQDVLKNPRQMDAELRRQATEVARQALRTPNVVEQQSATKTSEAFSAAAKELSRVAQAITVQSSKQDQSEANKLMAEFIKEFLAWIDRDKANEEKIAQDKLTYLPPPIAVTPSRLQQAGASTSFMLST